MYFSCKNKKKLHFRFPEKIDGKNMKAYRLIITLNQNKLYFETKLLLTNDVFKL